MLYSMCGDGGNRVFEYKYRRVLLKLSGEALMGRGDFGIDASVPERIACDLRPAHDAGVQIAIVVGGGNIFRGLTGQRQVWSVRRRTTWACSLP